MIPPEAVAAWRADHPWPDDAQVEQDLAISRALVDIFSEPFLTNAVAFRGGTALHKLFLSPPARHSVDVDLVQVDAGPIKPIFDALHDRLDPWLGKPSTGQNRDLVTLKYRYDGIAGVRQTLKVEINTREHGFVRGPARVPFIVGNSWFQGSAEILTYSIEELLATKFRALYRRDAGRDVFDLIYAIEQRPELDKREIVRCFLAYESRSGARVSRAEFEQNLTKKRRRRDFLGDVQPLLAPHAAGFDMLAGLDRILVELVALLPGDPWKGEQQP